jgi:hypothetical protein
MGEKKTKEEKVTTNTVQIMHITVSTADINLCQFRVLGQEIENKQAIRKQLRMRPNVTLPNEEYHKLLKKFVEKKPALSPKIRVSVKLDIQANESHSPPLKIMMAEEFGRKLATMTTINPYLSAPTADTVAQVIILGHNHSGKIGLNISCLPRTATLLDCANASATGAMACSTDA